MFQVLFMQLPAPTGKQWVTKRAASPFLPSRGRCGMRAAPRTVVWMAGSGFVVSLRRVCLPFPSFFSFFLPSFLRSFLPSFFPSFLAFFLFSLSFLSLSSFSFPFFSPPFLPSPSIFDVRTLRLLRKLLFNSGLFLHRQLPRWNVRCYPDIFCP